MSFILDALKKAESERNRQLGPVLMDARVAPSRRGLPPWGWVLAAVLVVNLVLLGWLLLRSPALAPAAGAREEAAPPAGRTPVSDAAVTSQATSAPDAPAAPTADATTTPPAPHPAPARAAGSPSLLDDVGSLPTAQQLQAEGVALPELQLNLHIYVPAPTQRYVLLNGQRLREGEYTPHGVRVERITEQYVVLEAQGRRFRLAAGG